MTNDIKLNAPKRRKIASLEKKKEAAPVPAPAQPVADPEPTTPATDDAVTVAVITAAIAAYLAAESENGEVKPTIYKVLPITEAEKAHDILYKGQNVGKVVLTLK